MATQTENLSIVLADDAAAGFSSVSANTHQAILTCENQPLRWRADGTAPTATVGTLMQAGDSLLLFGSDYNNFLRNLKIINATPGSNATLQGAGLSGLDRA